MKNSKKRILLPPAAKQLKSLAEFHARRREMILIVISDVKRCIAATQQEKPPWGVGPYARGTPASTYHGVGATLVVARGRP